MSEFPNAAPVATPRLWNYGPHITTASRTPGTKQPDRRRLMFIASTAGIEWSALKHGG
jgi:hypothetical protein